MHVFSNVCETGLTFPLINNVSPLNIFLVAGIKLGRHQKYLNSPGGSSDGDNPISHPESPSNNYPQLNQPSNSFSPNRMDMTGNPTMTKDASNYAGISGPSYAQLSNYKPEKEFGHLQDFTTCMPSRTTGHPSLMNSTVGHSGLSGLESNSRMNNHGFSVSGSSSMITSVPVTTNSYAYSSKGFIADVKTSTMDPLSFAVNQTLTPPRNGMLDLLNSPLDTYSIPDIPSKSNSYIPQMDSNSIDASSKLAPRYLSPSSSNQSYQNKPSPIKLEQPHIGCQLSSPEQSVSPEAIQHNTSSSNMVSTTTVNSPHVEERPRTPCSSCASSPSAFSEYEDDDKETRFDFDSAATQSVDSVNQSVPCPVISRSYTSLTTPSTVPTSVTTTSGSSFLMGNHWTSHHVDVPEIKQEPVVIIDGGKLVDPQPEVSPIDFELKNTPSSSTETSVSNKAADPSRRRKQMSPFGPDFESQMPELTEEYVAQLQLRLKLGCINGEVLSVESEARLLQIRDEIDDLERGSLMFELSHGYSTFKAQLDQINEQSVSIIGLLH